MKIIKTKNQISKKKIKTEIFKLIIEHIDTENDSIIEFNNESDLIETIKIVDEYLRLLETDHNNWCNIEPYMIVDAAKGINIDISIDDCYDLFSDYPGNSEFLSRPQSYKVTYTDTNKITYKCKISKPKDK